MNKELDKFSRLIEEKLNDFEVPYNESHWSEMSQKLDGSIPAAEVSSSLGKKFLWAGATAIVAISTWMLLTKENTPQKDLSENKISIPSENTLTNSETEFQPENIPSDQNEEQSDLAVEKTGEVAVKKEDKADKKINKYLEFTEQKTKDNSKKFIDQIDEEQKATYPDEPKVNPELKTDILLEKETFCVGDEVQFNIDREINGAKYYWDFGDKDLKSRKPRPVHKYKKPGTYNVILYVALGEIGDKNDYPAYKTIVVRPVPGVKIEKVFKQITLNDPYAEFNAITDCNCTFEWEFNSSQKANGREVSFLIPDKGSYVIKLSASNNEGCSNSIDDFYNAAKGVKIIVETGLTPNGDGKNDEFLPKELSISNVDFTFTVRDNSGQLVFKTKDKYNAWNGNLNNSGNPMPNGLYLWKVTFTDDRGKVHNQKGKITLLR